jgi:hypothetical protein
MEMGGSPNSTFLSTSDGDVVKSSNQIQISGAEVKVAPGLILAEPTIDELSPFVPELAHATRSGEWSLLRPSDRISGRAMRNY